MNIKSNIFDLLNDAYIDGYSLEQGKLHVYYPNMGVATFGVNGQGKIMPEDGDGDALQLFPKEAFKNLEVGKSYQYHKVGEEKVGVKYGAFLTLNTERRPINFFASSDFGEVELYCEFRTALKHHLKIKL